jgi:hypothetical protein
MKDGQPGSDPNLEQTPMPPEEELNAMFDLLLV